MMQNMYTAMGISPEVYEYGEQTLVSLKDRFDEIDKTAEYNQLKVLKAMQDCRVSEACLLGTTGYGYNDIGRDTLEAVYASLFHTEAALVRPQITCGTHALALALMSNLRPGDELLSPVGKPYDTLEEVIGIRDSVGSLKEFGITYSQVDLLPDGSFDFEGIRKAINERTKLVEIQRSKGYATRPSFSVEQIGELIRFCKEIKPDVKVMVDNCYGEFVERIEPSDIGADMVVGSLIKNPGGGLAPIGGYICGTKECVERCAYRLSAPGLGQEVGANLGLMPAFYQGLFLAPTVVSGALKGAVFAANVYEKLGFVKTGVRENCWRDQTGRLRTAVDYQLLPQQLRLPFDEKEPWVRDAVPADRKAIAEIYRTLFEAMSNLQPQYIQAAEQDPDFILKIITESKKDILVAQCGVQLLGFALVLMTHTPPYRCFVPHPYADLLDLAVLPDARGNGLGTLLLQAVKGWAKAYGADYLELGALSNNQEAIRLYEREGFRECLKTFRASL